MSANDREDNYDGDDDADADADADNDGDNDGDNLCLSRLLRYCAPML